MDFHRNTLYAVPVTINAFVFANSRGKYLAIGTKANQSDFISLFRCEGRFRLTRIYIP